MYRDAWYILPSGLEHSVLEQNLTTASFRARYFRMDETRNHTIWINGVDIHD